MSETVNVRQERIERLLHELRYEIERGLAEHEIDEDLTFRFVFGLSRKIPDGVVLCEFRTRPAFRYQILSGILSGWSEYAEPRLRVIK